MNVRWDLATRLFHWLLLLLVLLSWVSYEEDYINVHIYSGYGVLVLIVFRFLWGWFGSIHSRFSDFLHRPGVVIRYIKGSLPEAGVGHNPLGGWSVLFMLILLLMQTLTGLFNTDELIDAGPLNHLVSQAWGDRMGALHELLFWVLCAAVLLHVCAVLYHQVRGANLLWPMLGGGSDGIARPRSGWLALLIVLLLAGVLWLALSLVPAPEPAWY